MTDGKPIKKPLSALRLKNLKTGETVADIEENRGLRVTRSKAGWRYWYRFKHPGTGRLAELTLFTKDGNALAEARLVFAGLKQQRANGQIPELPPEYRKVPVLRDSPEPASPTVASIVKTYLADHVYRNRKLKGARETDRVLTNHVINPIGKLPADTLTRAAVLDLVSPQIKAGHNAQVGVMLRELDAAIEYAIGTNVLPPDFVNPAQLAKRSLRQAKTRLTAERRQRYLSDSELKSLLPWLPTSAFSRNHRFALALTLETGCRSGEAIAAEWEHFDLNAGLWHIPKTKTGVPRDVKLPRQTVAWLSAARTIEPAAVYLCPSPKGGHVQQKSISEQAWHMRRAGKMLGIAPWTAHDLRRTARTGLARLGCPQPVAEALLGHAKGGVVGVYDLHRYTDEGGVWLQKWADHLDMLRTKR
ncbi:MAG: tyrosine-type recombinase/integrase [Gammaproteobacteria bacterium]|nr:tyrosine-type recombinase/integrase [Gammaproteobacteria bacterium]